MCQVIETLLGNSLRLEFPVSLLGAEYNLGDRVSQSESSNGPARPIRGLTRSACNARSALAFISLDPAGNRDCEGPSPLSLSSCLWWKWFQMSAPHWRRNRSQWWWWSSVSCPRRKCTDSVWRLCAVCTLQTGKKQNNYILQMSGVQDALWLIRMWIITELAHVKTKECV